MRLLLACLLLLLSAGLLAAQDAAPGEAPASGPRVAPGVYLPAAGPAYLREARTAYGRLLDRRLPRALAEADLEELGNLLWRLRSVDAPELVRARALALDETAARARDAVVADDLFALAKLLQISAALREAGLVEERLDGDRLLQETRAAWQQQAAGWRDLADAAARWAELAPSPAAVELLGLVLPECPPGAAQAALLTQLGRAETRRGERAAALAHVRAAIAQPDLDYWPEGHLAAAEAFCAWAALEPEAALAAAQKQLGAYQTWGDSPAVLLAPVYAAAALGLVETDLPRALELAHGAPEAEWSLGGIRNTHGRTLITVAVGLAAQHPAEAELLFLEGFAAGGAEYYEDDFPRLLLLPREAARRVAQVRVDFAALRAEDAPELSYHSYETLAGLGRFDPGLLADLVTRWAGFFEASPAELCTPDLHNLPLTALVSAGRGVSLLHRAPEVTGERDAARPAWQVLRLVEWLDLLSLLTPAPAQS